MCQFFSRTNSEITNYLWLHFLFSYYHPPSHMMRRQDAKTSIWPVWPVFGDFQFHESSLNISLSYGVTRKGFIHIMWRAAIKDVDPITLWKNNSECILNQSEFHSLSSRAFFLTCIHQLEFTPSSFLTSKTTVMTGGSISNTAVLWPRCLRKTNGFILRGHFMTSEHF